jgi:two-component system, sensor histidine kinase and response regulator
MEYSLHRLQQHLPGKIKSIDTSNTHASVKEKFSIFFQYVKSIGATAALDDNAKRKLGIFNQLNFFQLITGIIAPVAGLFLSQKIPAAVWPVASLPAFISIIVLVLNAQHKYQAALLCYFIFYPVFTCIIYINGMNLGIELSFVLYGILSVFFLQDIGYMLFAVSLSMISYFVLSIVWKSYPYQLQSVNPVAYLINQALAILYIFYGLYLIKKENTDSQFRILAKNRELHNKNLEIEKQKAVISEKARLLETQAATLEELNAVKTKFFSVVSHDMKAPMYALRNLFRNARLHDLSADEIKEMIPEVVNDLDSTTALMENLLQWAKCQMQTNTVRPQKLDICQLVNEVTQLLQLQSTAKKICIERKTDLIAFAFADKDMINLVVRNLLSNAIKFTPPGGHIIIGTHESENCVEVYVQDSGLGISRYEMEKINQNNYYSTKGTGNETGTGLGLMLCKEFLAKNDGHMMIESEPGHGSTFSFTLPLALNSNS